MKSGTEYELFVKDIYESLNRADGLTDVGIQHDVFMTGLSGIKRQVDVFRCFKRAGIDEDLQVAGEITIASVR